MNTGIFLAGVGIFFYCMVQIFLDLQFYINSALT